MNFRKIFANIYEMPIDEALVEQVQKNYEMELPQVVKHILSLHHEVSFYDDIPLLRGLSFHEILTANEDLKVDFIAQSLLPVFDIGDNDFVVYDFSEQVWCLFNIVDEVKFRKSSDILTLIE